MKIIRKNELKTSRWSGGTTTQLFIYPEGSDYNRMDFDFRISTATVEVEQSTFTPLKGVRRTLMVLDGSLELVHKDHHATILQPLETDSFDGEWETTSGGTAVDLNLMIRHPERAGTIMPFQLGKKSDIVLETGRNGLIYLYKGRVSVNETTELGSGDAVYFESPEQVRVKGQSNTILIFVNIR